MPNYFEKLSRVSPAKVWDLISNPWRLPLVLHPPRNFRSSVDAARAFFPDLTSQQAKDLRLQFLRNTTFFAGINEKMVSRRERHATYHQWNEFVYLVVRICKPQVMIETGVFDGQSSAVILQALHDNQSGKLVSVDLPARSSMDQSTQCMPESALPSDCQPGWIIPNYLKERHQLVLGDSKKVLPELFEKHPQIDIFFHDSLHTYEHMSFEYNLAWPHLSSGGVLLSDDILWNAAFSKFCRENKRLYVCLGNFGAVRK